MTRHVVVEIKPSPEELAKEFASMDSDEQARFFSEIENQTKTWSRAFCFQLQAVTDSEYLTPGGRFIMQEIGQYSLK